MWEVVAALDGGSYCLDTEQYFNDTEQYFNEKVYMHWPLGAAVVDEGTAITMCDVFNARDYGKIDETSQAAEADTRSA